MNDTLWIVLTAVACVGGAASLYFMLRRATPALKALDKDFQIPDMRLHYTADALFACFDGVGEKGQALLRRYWLTDFGFIACFWFVMLAVGRNNVSNDALRLAMGVAASLRALLDMTENLLLTRVCAAYPARRMSGLARLCGFVTSAKFIALGLWLVGLFATLFIRGMAIGR